MEEVVSIGAVEAGKELIKKGNFNISLEGWPCAVAIVGLGIAYVISVKCKCDVQKYMIENSNVTNMEKIIKVA